MLYAVYVNTIMHKSKNTLSKKSSPNPSLLNSSDTINLIIISTAEIKDLSLDDLKSYINTLQNLQLDEVWAQSFVLAKYTYLAKLQKKELWEVLIDHPTLNLVWTIKDGKEIKFGFDSMTQSYVKQAQHDLVNTLELTHNHYIYKTLSQRYGAIVEYIDTTILPPQKLDRTLSNIWITSQEKPQNLNKILKVMDMLDTIWVKINHI